MISFVNFARIASICVVFHFVHCMVTLFTKLLAKFEFPARISNKTRLNCYVQPVWIFVRSSDSHNEFSYYQF